MNIPRTSTVTSTDAIAANDGTALRPIERIASLRKNPSRMGLVLRRERVVEDVVGPGADALGLGRRLAQERVELGRGEVARRVLAAELVADDLAAAELDHAAAHPVDHRVVVRGDHDGRAGAVDPVQQLHDPDRRLGVEVAGRLVGEQQRRVVDERARDRDTLLLAARELVGKAVELRRQAGQAQDVGDLRADLLAAAAGHLQRVGDVGVDGPVRQQLEVLEDDAEVAAVVRRLRARDVGERAARDADRAGGRVDLLDEEAHQRRLAAAGRAHEEHELATADRERDVVDAHVAARVELRDAGELDDDGARPAIVLGGALARADVGFGRRHPPLFSRGRRLHLPPRRACKGVCSAALSSGAMPTITSSTAPNGLPIHRVALEGTRATTILVAFDAGARTERPDENGMAHFLEHLVFKGGELYDDYRKVNETAERMGGVLNAYTSHDLVAFHITVRAESAMEAIDLLTDFVGRPKIDAGELDRERGVVIQEIQRYKDQPSAVAEMLIDEAAYGDHPLGRTVLGPEDHLRSFSRDAIVAFRERRWAGERGGAFIVGNLDHVPENGEVAELFGRFPSLPAPEGFEAAPGLSERVMVEQRDTNQSHLRMAYEPQVDVSDPAQRAAMTIYSTLLGGSMGSRLFDEIREQRGLCYSVWAIDHSFADAPALALGAGLDSSKLDEAYSRMREIVRELHDDGPTEEEVERARAYAAGRRVLAFENTNAVARYAANQRIVFDEEIDPDDAIARLDAVTHAQVAEVARGVDPDKLAVACVGPHEESDF